MCASPPPQLEDVEVSGGDLVRPMGALNFRATWEELPPESELEDDYGLGPRDSMQARAVRSAAAGC